MLIRVLYITKTKRKQNNLNKWTSKQSMQYTASDYTVTAKWSCYDKLRNDYSVTNFIICPKQTQYGINIV